MIFLFYSIVISIFFYIYRALNFPLTSNDILPEELWTLSNALRILSDVSNKYNEVLQPGNGLLTQWVNDYRNRRNRTSVNNNNSFNSINIDGILTENCFICGSCLLSSPTSYPLESDCPTCGMTFERCCSSLLVASIPHDNSIKKRHTSHTNIFRCPCCDHFINRNIVNKINSSRNGWLWGCHSSVECLFCGILMLEV